MQKRRKKYKKAFIQRHLGRWATSGLSISAYCQTIDVNPSNFHRWRKKFTRPSGDFINAMAIPECPEATSEGALFSITLPGNIQIHMQQAPPPRWVALLVTQLEGQS